jgi:small subunit ribosomal protein S7
MPRRARVIRRDVIPDEKYGNKTVARFVNRMMYCGKRDVAYALFYRAMDIIADQTKREPMEVFELAVKNATPVLEVKPRRVGGATYQVPVEIKGDRRSALAMRWLLKSARSRSGRSMAEKLAAEIKDASQGLGATVKKREDTHKMAEANRAFAHYRW